MPTINIVLSDSLDAALRERMNMMGFDSKEEYLLGLVESDCAAGTLDRALSERLEGPFVSLPENWKD